MADSLEEKVRESTGLGQLNSRHITWLLHFIKSFFEVGHSASVIFLEKGKYSIYLIPSHEKIITPSQAMPLSEEEFTKPRFNDMTIRKVEKRLSSVLNLSGYKIKIVRELPTKVKKADYVKRLVE
jgi:hypothetical protein